MTARLSFQARSRLLAMKVNLSCLFDSDRIVDPSLPHLGRKAADLYYFSAQESTVKQLKAAIEEAKSAPI